jgi:hypothetical protein
MYAVRVYGETGVHSVSTTALTVLLDDMVKKSFPKNVNIGMHVCMHVHGMHIYK